MANIQFVGSMVEVNKDTDILVEDMPMFGGLEGIKEFAVEQVLDGALSGEVFVVDSNIQAAEALAKVLNDYVAEEIGKLVAVSSKPNEEATKQNQKEEKDVEEMTVENKGVNSEKAAKFLKKHGAAMKNAQKAKENEKDVEGMEETKGAGRRRVRATATEESKKETAATKRRQLKDQVSTTTNKKEVDNVKKEETKATETKGAGRGGRKSTTGKERVAAQGSRVSPSGRFKRGASLTERGGFKKFEGPWYLNGGMYDVINRLEDIIANIEDGADVLDADLGIQEIAFVEPEDTRRYASRADVLLIVQVKSNGIVFDFPIKENRSPNSKSDLNCSSIGWIEYNEKPRPAYGGYVLNKEAVEAHCSCNHAFKAHPENIYCEKCETLYDVVDVDKDALGLSASFKKGEFGFKQVWNFTPYNNVSVPRETLALVMALAQYDLGYDMYDVIEEA